MQPFMVPQSAVAAGLTERYRYWYGASRRRYLFTRAPSGSAGEFEDAVLLAVIGGEIVWAGESGTAAAARFAGCELFVHLLAGSAEERRRIAADLRPARRNLALAA